MRQKIQIWNSLSQKKEGLLYRKNRPLQLFVCGPTVYDDAHLGHARTAVFFDFLVKYLKSSGIKVRYIQNVTDVDDKIINRAGEKGVNPFELARKFWESYLEDMKSLGVDSVNVYAHATKFIPQIVKQVQRLIKKGYVYEIPNDGYYFDITKFKDYGKLSGRTALEAEDAVSRIDDSVNKKNKGDFCVWKLAIDGEPAWKTPLGLGRPGWHIEDTAITEHFFGPQYDIHGGGIDLKFPHHEAEIAQQEAASGKKPFVKIWMHIGFLTVGGKKMSKSIGNFITIKDFLKSHSASVFRLICFNQHYKTPLDYNDQIVESAEETYQNLSSFFGKISFAKIHAPVKGEGLDFKKFEDDFNKSLSDDLNTPKALAAIFGLSRDANKILWKLGRTAIGNLQREYSQKLALLGVQTKEVKIPTKIKRLISEREEFRRNQQFIQSDVLRKKIEGLGYTLEDTPFGPFVWPKNK